MNNGMNFDAKEFLRLTLAKAGLTVFLLITGALASFLTRYPNPYGAGLPFSIYTQEHILCLVPGPGCGTSYYFSGGGLAGDVVFWYVASAAIVLGIEKLVKK